MKDDDKSVLNLLKSYVNAEQRVLAATHNKRLTVKQYQSHLNQVVNEVMSTLQKKNKTFGEKETVTAFTDGKKKTDTETPEQHKTITQKQASAILRSAGFRYDGREFGYDTYIELQSATQAAGTGFLERVNKTIKHLEKTGQDTIYNVTEAIKKDIESNGLLNVEYSNGRKVSISSYAHMAARSARMESVNIGAFGRALENGTDYVRCTEIWPTCEICAKYQGRIYCISGRDKRFPALFETALRHGYAIMHPHCRHEFIPVWLELMDKDELEKEIRRSQIPKASDPRSVKERNAYAEWQAERRQVYNEQAYFEKARQTLGFSMPYKDIGAFRRSYRAKEGSLAHRRSHNLINDYQIWRRYREELGKGSLPKTLEKYQEIVYNKDDKDNLDHYIAARRRGSVSAVVGFSDWQSMNTRLCGLLVGQKAVNGVIIRGISKHFVDRVIGTIYPQGQNKIKHEGVSVKQIQNAVLQGKEIQTKTDSRGRKSTLLSLEGICDVTINSETGVLIQCNPISK